MNSEAPESVVPTPENPLYGVSTVAKMFDVNTSQVRVWIRDGDIKAHKIAGRWRIQKSEVTAFANRKYGA